MAGVAARVTVSRPHEVGVREQGRETWQTTCDKRAKYFDSLNYEKL